MYYRSTTGVTGVYESSVSNGRKLVGSTMTNDKVQWAKHTAIAK